MAQERAHILVQELTDRFVKGESLAIVCKDGVGLSAVIGACVMINSGVAGGAAEAIQIIRSKRKDSKCLSNRHHQDFVKEYEQFALVRGAGKEKVQRLVSILSMKDERKQNDKVLLGLRRLSTIGKHIEEMQPAVPVLVGIISSPETNAPTVQRHALEVLCNLLMVPSIKPDFGRLGGIAPLLRWVKYTEATPLPQMTDSL
jgi:hypothetical protein